MGWQSWAPLKTTHNKAAKYVCNVQEALLEGLLPSDWLLYVLIATHQH
jgi:hypothetical protein